MVTEEQIKNVFERLEEAMNHYWEWAENEIDAKVALEQRKLQALADGTIEGKNAELREANARALLGEYYDTLEDAETNARMRKLELDLAKLDLEKVKMLLRLDELMEIADDVE